MQSINSQAEFKEELKNHLSENSGRIGKIYSKTYYSLLDRIEQDGYLPESKTGLYPGMFMRTIGAITSLFIETECNDKIEAMLRFCIESMHRYKMHRIPHLVNRVVKDSNGKLLEKEISKDDQIDGQAHVIMSWAKLAITRGLTVYEDETYGIFKNLMNDCLDMPYFYYGGGPYIAGMYKEIRLIHNLSFEHSRENRRWQAFDILSQCFTGAAGEAMISVAKRRGDTESAELWKNRLEILREGIRENLTRIIDGKTVYLEMRLPDGCLGRPFLGMGWLNLSPVAAQWQPLEETVLDNTIETLRRKLWQDDPAGIKLRCMLSEYEENGTITNEIIGKSIGWDIEYSRSKQDFARILEWFKFIEYYNTMDVYMEFMKLVDGKWKITDPGNGEQCSWWCWSIARLRREVGMDPVPERV